MITFCYPNQAKWYKTFFPKHINVMMNSLNNVTVSCSLNTCVLIVVFFLSYNSKSNSHDKEVQRLYEEMELQIRTERERIRNEVIHTIQTFSIY